ncbi:MAG: hypothetical protein A3B37_01875 [Candidatus Sungbacteria bacterium RIFCSPLOWO2_01_FULL_59_16]|uniref:DOD-type homing endonuclease domain-containing protein n=1 Tax=Candidatus Sungbacteria bacterium RIFCSPLOWO2_01_FULL_59_16 TaxID=1802280 RepID=A0A1G2LAK3_9BACT|nr:MAG: hypothetical protein A3B37_01875 [Candidatus Sungbacteria bacterium RIFCSPLOWO2_01_FULL_59_16]
MPRRWTPAEERSKSLELKRLYVRENKTIGEIGKLLGIAEQTVFQRLERLGIPTAPERKATYAARRRQDVVVPKCYTAKLAEFFGIMLGDGRLAPYQVVVTLGTKEYGYARHVCWLMEELFGVLARVAVRGSGYRDVYLGSLDLVEWFKREGLVHNKVRFQVDIPAWIFSRREFLNAFVRGFFDTDGSVYALRFGTQLSFTNRSAPLLRSLRRALLLLGYHPSMVSSYCIYLTRRDEIVRFFREVRPANIKHRQRFAAILGR